jgi:hypothetical protein
MEFTGSERLPLLFIGKYEKPRCFKNIKSLPVQYYFNKKSWMTSQIWNDWLQKWDLKLSRQGQRKILLFVDNCPAHPKEHVPLKNIKLEYFPPNTTSKTQPMDQGIIANLKQKYRKKLIQRLLTEIDVKVNEKEKTFKNLTY